jgi:hexosaminidase
MWAYMENVEQWFQESEYVKYGNFFERIWAASAFKGASSELTTITSVEHHYLNQLSWNRVIHAKKQSKVCNFVGVAITGWSR